MPLFSSQNLCLFIAKFINVNIKQVSLLRRQNLRVGLTDRTKIKALT